MIKKSVKAFPVACVAFFFNGVGVPLATTGLVHPSWAMIAMALSVSLVLANSFGGRLFKARGGVVAQPSTIPETSSASPDRSAAVQAVVLTVPGIHCQGCVDTIEAYLSAEEGIEEVEADFASKAVHLRYRSNAMTPEHIKATLARIGYRGVT